MILECNDFFFAKVFDFDNRQNLIDGSNFFKDFLLSSTSWKDLVDKLTKTGRIVTESQVT